MANGFEQRFCVSSLGVSQPLPLLANQASGRMRIAFFERGAATSGASQPDYEVGDYLVRALLGADTASGGLAVGDTPRVGQTFRFHVRDEASADADLDATLAAGRRRLGRRTPGAALLFACNGRGSNLFSTPDHDATRVAVDLGVPSAGIFCQGEFGPVGGANHLHGFTATVAVFPH